MGCSLRYFAALAMIRDRSISFRLNAAIEEPAASQTRNRKVSDKALMALVMNFFSTILLIYTWPHAVVSTSESIVRYTSPGLEPHAWFCRHSSPASQQILWEGPTS